MKDSVKLRVSLFITVMVVIVAASTRLRADSGICGGANVTLPFTDIAGSAFFCQIASAYFSGLTNGTSATTYSPGASVTREQMAAFVTRAQDSAIKRGSRRAALNQFWTSQDVSTTGLVTVSHHPLGIQSDGADLWIASAGDASVSRVRASDGKLLETWTGATGAMAVLVAMGRVFVTGQGSGTLYMLDPSQPAGDVSVVTSSLGGQVKGIAFDGARIWVANDFFPGAVQIITPGNTLPWQVTTVTTGFNRPFGILYDGSNIWVTDHGDDTIKKLDSSGNVILSVNVGTTPGFPIFDGTNIWVPCATASAVTVVRAVGAQSGTVLATLIGNGLNFPQSAAFDGERILVPNIFGGSVSLWRATDLTPLGSFATGVGSAPFGSCSDGLNFWITLNGIDKIARF